MIIGGLQPITLLDYPQKVAAIVFFKGCNMRCPFCYNPDLVLPDLIKKNQSWPEQNVFDFLNRRQRYLDGVVLTGGEPLMQSDILSFCLKVKKMGYLLKLDTNGLLPDKLKQLIDKKLIDYVAMDIKGPINNLKKFCGVNVSGDSIKRSINIILTSGLAYEFRSTLIKGYHDGSDVASMAQLIKGANKYYLQTFSCQKRLVGKDFSGQGFDQKEMNNFCHVAKKYVASCEIR